MGYGPEVAALRRRGLALGGRPALLRRAGGGRRGEGRGEGVRLALPPRKKNTFIIVLNVALTSRQNRDRVGTRPPPLTIRGRKSLPGGGSSSRGGGELTVAGLAALGGSPSSSSRIPIQSSPPAVKDASPPFFVAPPIFLAFGNYGVGVCPSLLWRGARRHSRSKEVASTEGFPLRSDANNRARVARQRTQAAQDAKGVRLNPSKKL